MSQKVLCKPLPIMQQVTGIAISKCSIKKVFLKISQNPQEKTYARVSFLINLHAEACNFTLDSGTGDFP